MKPFLFFLSLTLLSFAPHDYFVSICTIKHVEADSTLQITWRMTTHDIEHALEKELGGIAHFGSDKETERTDSLLQAYLLNNISIQKDGKELTLEYVGKEIEYEDMYCYLRVTGVPKYKMLSVTNALLFELNDEQSNVIHMENGSGTKSKHCTREEPEVRFAP